MRVPGLDLLRGICAVAVAVYHVLYWHDVAKLYTWGTYGVYVFFALSGASMVVAYTGRVSSVGSIVDFLLLRLARLMPLYALAMMAGLFRQYRHLDISEWPLSSFFLNLFFLFGAGNPGASSRVVGGWSLGIEFVFYLMFPVFLALTMSRLLPYVLVITFLTQHVFIGAVLGNGKGLAENWIPYTQFLSFIFGASLNPL
jgi:peptidoglycan/LPS O-acetylase OafA/YrhL